jgi:hypothetical protein
LLIAKRFRPDRVLANYTVYNPANGEFVYLCEDGTRAGLVTNGVGIPSHPELARREQQLA